MPAATRAVVLLASHLSPHAMLDARLIDTSADRVRQEGATTAAERATHALQTFAACSTDVAVVVCLGKPLPSSDLTRLRELEVPCHTSPSSRGNSLQARPKGRVEFSLTGRLTLWATETLGGQTTENTTIVLSTLCASVSA